MLTLAHQNDIAQRMTLGTNDIIPPDAMFHQTTNGYWIAWLPENQTAAILTPEHPHDEPCDWLEGADSLAEVVSLIESGEYAELVAFDDHLSDTTEHFCTCSCGHEH